MIAKNDSQILNFILNLMGFSLTIGDVYKVVSGYYAKRNDIYMLEKCFDENIGTFSGVSKCLDHRVSMETKMACRMVKKGDINAFEKLQDVITSQMLIKDKTVGQTNCEYPFWEEYLLQCEESDIVTGMAAIKSILSAEQWRIMNSKKIILSTTKRCTAAIDSIGGYAYPVGDYGLVPISKDLVNGGEDALMLLLGILNSNLFNFCIGIQRISDSKWENSHDKKKLIDVIRAFPYPNPTVVLEGKLAVVKNLVQCIVYLQDIVNCKDSILESYVALRYIELFCEILDMAIFEMYLPEYVKVRGAEVLDYMKNAPFMHPSLSRKEKVIDTYNWYMDPDNRVRQTIMVLDINCPELYRIQNFNPDLE